MQVVRGTATPYSWAQVDDPVYVVDFTGPAAALPERWRLSGVADVVEALDWVERNRRGRSCAISLEISDEGGLLLVPLTPAAGLRRVSGW